MTNVLVAKTLQKNFLSAVAASAIPSIPINLPGISFDVPHDQKYIEFNYFPNDPDGEYWNDEKVYRGIFSIGLHWPIDGGGIYLPIENVMSVANYFDKGRHLHYDDFSVRVTRNPRFTGPIAGDKDMVFPVSMWYRSFRFS